jgi:hypothetical protein
MAEGERGIKTMGVALVLKLERSHSATVSLTLSIDSTLCKSAQLKYCKHGTPIGPSCGSQPPRP